MNELTPAQRKVVEALRAGWTVRPSYHGEKRVYISNATTPGNPGHEGLSCTQPTLRAARDFLAGEAA